MKGVLLHMYFLQHDKNLNAFFYPPGVCFWGKEMSDQSQYFRTIVFH